MLSSTLRPALARACKGNKRYDHRNRIDKKQTNKKLVDAKLKLPKTTRVPTLSRSTKQLLADKSKIIIQNNTMAHNKAIWIVISTQLKDKMIGYTNK